MNKHTEAILALAPFAALLDSIEDIASACSASSGEEAIFSTPIKLSDLLEASRVMKEWQKKQSHPVLRARKRCKTCGVVNYYQNLIKGRCAACDDEYRVFLAFSEIEITKEKKSRGKKKAQKSIDSIYEKMVKEMRAMEDDELEDFMKRVLRKDAIFYRKLLEKY